MTFTHTDGYPVHPARAGALLIGMGERYDVQVTLADGVFPLVALAEGKNSTALALVRTGTGSAPPATIRPAELNRVPHGYGALHPAASAALPARQPDVIHRLELTGGMGRYNLSRADQQPEAFSQGPGGVAAIMCWQYASPMTPTAGPAITRTGKTASAATVAIPATARGRDSGAGAAISRLIRAEVADPPAPRAAAPTGAGAARASSASATFSRGEAAAAASSASSSTSLATCSCPCRSAGTCGNAAASDPASDTSRW
jgi:Multicopper oxidase